MSDPNGIRTRATAVKGQRPRPLNDGAYKEILHSTKSQEYWVNRPLATRNPFTGDLQPLIKRCVLVSNL